MSDQIPAGHSAVYNLIVNGKPVQVTAAPDAKLMDVLRDQLRLTGVKDGCATGHCGSCMIIQDGKAVRACLVLMKRANNSIITTIEGITGENGALHPIQQKFIEHGATQCGFCTPGFIVSTKALLDKNPQPTLAEIYDALKWNICRCTGHNAILRAVQDLAGQPVPPLPSVKNALQAISRPLPRPDAVSKANGTGIYVDDLFVEGMLYAKVLRSQYSHARLKRVDVNKAKALPGVITVLTADDVPGRKEFGVHEIDWPVLCYDKVRYVGDAIALVAAESEKIAEDALKLIEVDYEPLPVVAGPKQAAQPDAPLIHEHPEKFSHDAHGNFLAHFNLENGNLADGFASSDVVIEREYTTQTVEHAFIEPEAALAVPDATGRITVYCGGQIPFNDRACIAASLNVPEENVRVVNCLIGGAFGGKEDPIIQIHVALLAQKTKHAVKLVFSRKESLLVHPKRHATIIKMKTGAMKDGTLVAHEVEIYGDGGAYASLSNHVMLRSTTHAAGPYEVPNIRVNTYAMYTNNVPSGAFRGFGVTQSAFAMESQMDELAKALDISPVEIRRKNILKYGKRTLAGQVMTESCGLEECVEKVVAEMSKHDFVPIEEDKRRAWGVACAYKNTGFGSGAYDAAGAEVELFADGRAAIRAGAAEIGQGLVGVLAQIVSEELGVSYDKVDVLVADTDRTLDGFATTASRQTYVTGNAARHACQEARTLLSQVAAEMLDAPPDGLVFKDGYVFANKGTEGTQVNSQSSSTFLHVPPRVKLTDVVIASRREGRIPKVSYQYAAPHTEKYQHFAFGFGAQAALVEVDVKTGETRVLKVIAACDVGRVMNPLALLGQIEGSISMGLGMALQENFVMKEGYVQTDSLYKCRLPTIDQTPEVTAFFVEHETQEGPYGAKGVGELASIPTAPAIINAIYNATGVRCYNLPADKEWLKNQMGRG
ncbi:MAG: molybdopterin-dependent oxidoreductase [Chloroflexi bacterium]|nr:molybdopterin-dependent oxidoreductase [Chloroflexota bacterium]